MHKQHKRDYHLAHVTMHQLSKSCLRLVLLLLTFFQSQSKIAMNSVWRDVTGKPIHVRTCDDQRKALRKPWAAFMARHASKYQHPDHDEEPLSCYVLVVTSPFFYPSC